VKHREKIRTIQNFFQRWFCMTIEISFNNNACNSRRLRDDARFRSFRARIARGIFRQLTQEKSALLALQLARFTWTCASTALPGEGLRNAGREPIH
jgi:hypothetical protein